MDRADIMDKPRVESDPYHVDDTLGRRKRRWWRRLMTLFMTPLILLAGFLVYLDVSLNRVDLSTDGSGRPSGTRGTNWLIVGSDSRDGLSAKQRKQYHTGGDAGARTDSIMLLHVGDHGSTLVSLPRDSYVPIPANGHNKLNAAFALGGARLLVQTVEDSTRLRIDHYAEIGFGGFVGMVDSVGGIRMCIDKAVRDKKAGVDLGAGCQKLNGGQALGYVRSRHAFVHGDLDRAKHQREFLAALVHKVMSPGVLADPLRILPFALKASDDSSVAEGDHLWNLVALAWAMRNVSEGGGTTTAVPLKGGGSAPGVGNYVRWDPIRAPALFEALREDRPVPKSI